METYRKYLKLKLGCYWLSISVFLVGIGMVVCKMTECLFLLLGIFILALSIFFVGLYYSIYTKQAKADEQFSNMEKLCKIIQGIKLNKN